MLLKVRNENGTFEDVEVIKGEKGQDGAIQYTAGTGIEITSNNVINNTQSGATWGNITGALSNQSDLNTKFNTKANRNHQHEMLDITDGFELRESYTQDAYCVYSTTYLNTQLNNKANSTAIPTKTSDLTNDSNFTTTTYVDTQVGTANTNITQINTEIGKLKTQNYIGDFMLYDEGALFNNTGAWQDLQTIYFFKDTLLGKFPLKDGYTRSYKLAMEYSDNITSGGTYIKLVQPNDNTTLQELVFPYTNGEATKNCRRHGELTLNSSVINNIVSSHLKIQTTPQFSQTGKSVYIHRLYIRVFDTLA